MTDKELRKLSRLELLELLLEASKENRKLKEKVNRLIAENQTAKNIENLSEVTRQAESVLRYANSITNSLKVGAGEVFPSALPLGIGSMPESEIPEINSQVISDKDIYLKMMCFFAMNEDKLKVFPEDIESVVRGRIINILERGSLN